MEKDPAYINQFQGPCLLLRHDEVVRGDRVVVQERRFDVPRVEATHQRTAIMAMALFFGGTRSAADTEVA